MTRKRRIFSILLVLMATGLPHVALGTSVLQLNDDYIARAAHLVIEGVVVNTHSYWNDDHTSILTAVTVDIESVLKGTPPDPKTLKLDVVGGTVDSISVMVIGAPVLRVGERWILCLRKDLRSMMPIIGLYQGMYRVTTGIDGTRQVLNRSVSRDDFVERMQGFFEGRVDTRPRRSQSSAKMIHRFRLQDRFGCRSAPQNPPPFLHWDLRELPGCQVPYSVGTVPVDLNEDGNIDAGDRALARQEIDASAAQWTGPRLIHPVDVNSSMPDSSDISDKENTVTFETLPKFVFGLTRVFWDNNFTGRIFHADIMLNSTTEDFPDSIAGEPIGRIRWVAKADGETCRWDRNAEPFNDWPNGEGDTDELGNGNGIQEFEIDLQSIVVHEFGHFLGIAHSHPLGTSQIGGGPVMTEFFASGGPAAQQLHIADEDAERFLYNPDLGDAEDPFKGLPMGFYPSKMSKTGGGRTLNGFVMNKIKTGAIHFFGIKPRQETRNWTYEWLDTSSTGPGVDRECFSQQVDKDGLDNGVRFVPNPPLWECDLSITPSPCYASDDAGNFHDYIDLGALWVNMWADWNQNGEWETPGERILNASYTPPPPDGPNIVMKPPDLQSVTVTPAVPPDSEVPVWMRVRLDWRENVGAGIKVEPSLSQTRYAAQFGEVEDYPFTCATKSLQLFGENATGQTKDGMALVFVGDSQEAITFAAYVDGGDCVLAEVDSFSHSSAYDEFTNETTVEYFSNVSPNEWFHTGREQIAHGEVQQHVRAHWIPEGGGSPTIDDWLPTTNTMLIPHEDRLVVVVGAVNEAVGGRIPEPFAVGEPWDDSLMVDVYYAVIPTPVPLSNLSLCDSLISSIAMSFGGTAAITPSAPMYFELSSPEEYESGQTLLLSIMSTWTLNGNSSCEIIQYDGPNFPNAVGDSTPSFSSGVTLSTYPNPFNPSLAIRFTLPRAGSVAIAIYDIQGKPVKHLERAKQFLAGEHLVSWDGTNDQGARVATGVYFVRLNTAGESFVVKTTLLK